MFAMQLVNTNKATQPLSLAFLIETYHDNLLPRVVLAPLAEVLVITETHFLKF